MPGPNEDDPVPAALKKRGTFPRSLSELVSNSLTPSMPGTHAINSNLGVDYVISLKFDPKNKEKDAAKLEELVHKLAQVGLATEVRNGDDNNLLVFVKVASEEHMFAEIYRSRVRDWIHGVRSSEPAKDTEASLEEDPLTDAERLRTIFQLISNDEDHGGAGIKSGTKGWENVDKIFTLHDHIYNKHWIQKWSTEYHVNTGDLDEIRDRFGEKVAYYFAFEQTYFTFLLVPSALGILAYFFLGSFSALYGAFLCVWSIVFVEWWKHQERDLAIRWGVQHVSNIESKRYEFVATTEVEDSATGEMRKTFPASQRLQRQVLQLPFVILAVLALGSLIVLCFAIEIFIGEIYDGPGKSVLTFTPTIILTTCLPILNNVLSDVAKRLNDFENYETDSQYSRALTGKLFVLNFITSYMGIILTAFVYIPFGNILVPYLDVFNVVMTPLVEKSDQLHSPRKGDSQYTINPDRLRKQVIYFAVTASIVNFAMEVVVPYLKRQGFIKIKELRASRAKNADGSSTPSSNDPAEEKEFLHRVRSEAELPAYDVEADFREMIIQFGYLALFGIAWPLVPLCYLVNNWFELRADAFKICLEMQRPTPWRADSIGPWLDALSFLVWLGSLSMAALSYMFANEGLGADGAPHDLRAWGLLLAIFGSEHLYLFVHWAVAFAISKIDSPGRQKERRDRWLTREKFVTESLNAVKRVKTFDDGNGDVEEKITRGSLEEDARAASLKKATPEERFWARQKGWRESARVGRSLIEQAKGPEKESKKEL